MTSNFSIHLKQFKDHDNEFVDLKRDRRPIEHMLTMIANKLMRLYVCLTILVLQIKVLKIVCMYDDE